MFLLVGFLFRHQGPQQFWGGIAHGDIHLFVLPACKESVAGCLCRAEMCGKARQDSAVATALRVRCLAEVPVPGEKQVTGPGLGPPALLVPKTEAGRVSGSTTIPLEARSVTTECICCGSTLFLPSPFSPKVVMYVVVPC